MALKPNDGETFLKEVDDELRRERVNNFVTRYGWWLVGGVVLLLAAVAGWIWWSGRSAEAGEAAGENMVEALRLADERGAQSKQAAASRLAGLADSDIEGYRAAARFARANAQLQAGNQPAAIATLRSIADDQGLDELYRQAAQIRRTALEYDNLQPQEVIRRLGPLAQPDSAWLASAGELVGMAHLRMNRPDLAGPIFVHIARQEQTPESLKDRARHMAGSLGYDVNLPPAGQRAAPAANRAAPAPATQEKAR